MNFYLMRFIKKFHWSFSIYIQFYILMYIGYDNNFSLLLKFQNAC